MRATELFEYLNIEKTKQNFGDKLLAKANTDRSAKLLSIDELLSKITSADPTSELGTYVNWLIRTYLNGGIRYLEDLSRTKYALSLFHKFKYKLPTEQRDINKIKTLPDLENLVSQFEEQKTGKEEKKEISDKIKNETTIVYKGPEGTILIPETEQASCFWGKGTKWCTAATKSDNEFETYNEDGPLYIIILPNGEKYQLHVETGSLMDAQDNEIDVDLFNQKHPWVLKKIIQTLPKTRINILINHYPDSLKFLKHTPLYSKDILITYIQKNPEAIKHITDASDELIRVAYNAGVELDKISPGSIFSYFNLSNDMIKFAIDNSPENLFYIENLTPDWMKYAIDKYGPAIIQYLHSAPNEIQIYALKKDPNVFRLIRKPSKDARKFINQ